MFLRSSALHIILLQLEGEDRYEYREPVQRPIAPAYSPYFKQEFHEQELEEMDVNTVCSALMSAIDDFRATSSNTLEHKKVSSDDALKRLKSCADIPDMPENWKLPKSGLMSVIPNKYPGLNKDIIEKRMAALEKQLNTPVDISAAVPKKIVPEKIEARQEEYKHYVELLEQQQDPNKSNTGSETEEIEDELVFTNVLGKTLHDDDPINKSDFTKMLAEATKDLHLRCSCDTESDSD